MGATAPLVTTRCFGVTDDQKEEKVMLTLVFKEIALTLALALLAAPAAAQAVIDADDGRFVPRTISGRATVVDADTLTVADPEGRWTVRLSGIDAPGTYQVCDLAGGPWVPGREAAVWLRSLLAGKRVVCSARGLDRHGHAIATCYAAGRNVNQAVVAEGWAFAYVKFSDRYAAEEAAARKAGRGVWRGECDPPWRWRANARRWNVKARCAAAWPADADGNDACVTAEKAADRELTELVGAYDDTSAAKVAGYRCWRKWLGKAGGRDKRKTLECARRALAARRTRP